MSVRSVPLGAPSLPLRPGLTTRKPRTVKATQAMRMLEDNLQKLVVQILTPYRERGKIEFGAVPNGMRARSRRTAGKMKGMGMRAGVPDLFVMWEGGFGWIELKVKGGKISDDQKAFRVTCGAFGINHAYCYGVDEVLNTLRTWGAPVS